MANNVTCQLCGDRIECGENLNPLLGDHMINEHPDIDIAHFLCDDLCDDDVCEAAEKPACPCKGKGRERNDCNMDKRGTHRTTVEKWGVGGEELKCPKCYCCEKPFVRKRKNKITFNPLGSFCLLGCWPICFLPMMMCGKTTLLVCCRNCGYCFGEYNTKLGKLCPLDEEKIIELPDICPE